MKLTPLFFSHNSSPQPADSKTTWKLFIDGASRGNPGPSGAGMYLTCNGVVLKKQGIFLGKKTNNQAEYFALALGIFLVKEAFKKNSPCALLSITSDSELLVKQMKGLYKVKNSALAELKSFCEKMLKDIPHAIHHVLREHNKIADELANEGIETKTPFPAAFIKLFATHNVTL